MKTPYEKRRDIDKIAEFAGKVMRDYINVSRNRPSFIKQYLNKADNSAAESAINSVQDNETAQIQTKPDQQNEATDRLE